MKSIKSFIEIYENCTDRKNAQENALIFASFQGTNVLQDPCQNATEQEMYVSLSDDEEDLTRSPHKFVEGKDIAC